MSEELETEVDRHAEIMETPISERPDTEEMSVEELRAEYKTFDVAALSTVEDDERWERHLELWRELESRDVVEFPECARENCGALALLSIGTVAAWIVAGVAIRLRAREEEQFDRDQMYPPAEYWRGDQVNEGD